VNETSAGPEFHPRILLVKSFLDSHDRATKTISQVLRDGGMEVILLEYEIAEQIAAAAIQEDVDVIGVSFMSGGQVQVTRLLAASLAEQGRPDIPIVIGGTIRPFDVPELEEAGVQSIFRGGEPLSSIVEVFRQLAVSARRAAGGRGGVDVSS
jgi:methylmalonyl-CoA mutase C-terminal domain/subunit